MPVVDVDRLVLVHCVLPCHSCWRDREQSALDFCIFQTTFVILCEKLTLTDVIMMRWDRTEVARGQRQWQRAACRTTVRM